MCSEVFHNLAAILKEKGLNTAVGDEGGFAPELEPLPPIIPSTSDYIIFPSKNQARKRRSLLEYPRPPMKSPPPQYLFYLLYFYIRGRKRISLTTGF